MTFQTTRRPSTSNRFLGTAPVTRGKTEKNPRAVFQRLFGAPDGDVLNRSVLDSLQGNALRLSKRLARSDRQKLEEYLDGVRQTERRIQLAEQAAARIGSPPSL